MMKSVYYFLLSIIITLYLSSCAGGAKNNNIIVGKPILVTTATGLQYYDLIIGTGAVPKKGTTVKINYISKLDNGQEIENTYKDDKPLSFQFGDSWLIKGIEEGLSSMKTGGKRRLIIPPELGYGDRRIGKIPPNSKLIYEVELVEVK